jgi:RNA polymerase sigma-70 factor, ECF subfamily
MYRQPSNEQELLERARQHDEPAFAALIDLYTPALFRIVRRMVSDTLEAESIVQETFWRFWQALPRYSADRPLLPYLAAIASNLARDLFRRDRRIEDVPLEHVLEGRAPESDLDLERLVDDESTLRRLARSVQALPFAYRTVIALRYDAGLSYDEIAAVLSLPLNTVRTHLRRAKEMLRRSLEEID